MSGSEPAAFGTGARALLLSLSLLSPVNPSQRLKTTQEKKRPDTVFALFAQ